MIKAIMNTETLLSWTRLLPSFQPPFFIQLWTRINSNIFISDNLSRFPWSKAGNICVLILHSVDGANSGRKKKKRHRAKSSKWKRKTVWKVSLNYWLNESRGIIKRSISRVLMESSSFSCTLNIKYSSSTLFLCKHEEQVASDKREGDIPTKCDAKSAPRKPTTLHTNTLKIQSIEPEKKSSAPPYIFIPWKHFMRSRAVRWYANKASQMRETTGCGDPSVLSRLRTTRYGGSEHSFLYCFCNASFSLAPDTSRRRAKRI